MKPIRILISIIVAFVLFMGTSYLIHEVWLKPVYQSGMGKLWKEPVMSGIIIGHALMAVAFAMLWARIAFGGAGIQCAIALGIFLGLFHAGGSVIQHAVMPLPEGLTTKWILAAFAQTILVGIVLFFVHKPAKDCPPMS